MFSKLKFMQEWWSHEKKYFQLNQLSNPLEIKVYKNKSHSSRMNIKSWNICQKIQIKLGQIERGQNRKMSIRERQNKERSNRKMSIWERQNKERSNRKMSNRKRSKNRERSNRKRSNRKRSNRKRSNRKGPNLFERAASGNMLRARPSRTKIRLQTIRAVSNLGS